MLHRFRDAERGVPGHDPQRLRTVLAYLRRNGYELLGLTEVFERLAEAGRPLSRAVAFTIDDGYYDHAQIAGPVFAEFDCPVTTFVVSGFLDRKLWLWWDRIDYVLTNSRRTSIEVSIDDHVSSLSLSDRVARDRFRNSFIEYCKRLPDERKLQAIETLADCAEVSLPGDAPPAYEPMSWNDLRRCETRGMTFGPHTVTHPVLSRTTDAQANFEIGESWHRLCQEARRPDPVFCYPNGGWGDFTDREVELVRQAGLIGAVVGEPGYASSIPFRQSPTAPFMVRRFSYDDELPAVVQCVAGIERVKSMLRQQRETAR
jgi:peptidoglycan/xylan/chitin deacetylase (PgdA/CDA1 family)